MGSPWTQMSWAKKMNLNWKWISTHSKNEFESNSNSSYNSSWTQFSSKIFLKSKNWQIFFNFYRISEIFASTHNSFQLMNWPFLMNWVELKLKFEFQLKFANSSSGTAYIYGTIYFFLIFMDKILIS